MVKALVLKRVIYLYKLMKHVLITGGAGFIGSNLIRALFDSGNFKISCIDNFDDFYSRRQKEWNIRTFKDNENFRLIEGDIREAGSFHKIEGDIDTIVHLAAKAGVRPSIINPVLYLDVNIRGTQMLLEYAKLRSVKQFVFTSSSSVYGINNNVPWRENENLMPISPYASSKLSGEMLGHVYSHLYGIRFLSLRLFTVYGPSQRPDLAIHKFFKSIINGQPIPVFGDGTASRDYTYVGDTIRGIMAAMDYDRSSFEIINLGNNKAVTLTELINAIERICGKKAIIDQQPEQPGDVPRTFADISKAKELLNYNPSMELGTGLVRFYEWFKEYADSSEQLFPHHLR
jgi:UDP-glucuronate 4-epimerase